MQKVEVWLVIFLLSFFSDSSVANSESSREDQPIPIFKKEPGRCSIFGVYEQRGLVNNTFAIPQPDLPYCQEFKDLACCNYEQASQVQVNIEAKVAFFFARCPACIENFRTFWCQFTCSPNQSMFIDVWDDFFNEAGQRVVNHTNFAVDEDWANGFFDSCKDVKFGFLGVNVMDIVFGNAKTAMEFLDVMGGPGQAPELITFTYDPPVPYKLTGSFHKCVESCSCNDCSDSCAAPPQPPVTHDHFIHLFGKDIPLVTFVVSVVAICWTVLVLAVAFAIFVFRALRGRRGATEESVGRSEGKVHHYGGRTDWFWYQGRLCARYPRSFLLLGLLSVLLLSIAIPFRIRVETDPEKLWTSSSNDIEQDKLTFDRLFTPFYRIEQVIVSIDGSNSSATLLSKDSLIDVLNFQYQIGNMTVKNPKTNESMNLESFCARPVQNGGCLIQTPLGYWQMDINHLKAEPNITAHLADCFQKPILGDNCRDQTDSPVDPTVVFGGYPLPDQYLKATALVLTYLLNNFNDSDYQEAVLVWEKAFLDLVQQQLKGYKLIYSAQRSVEDELARETTADVPTVATSYLVMFLYVALALGSYVPFRLHTILVQSKVLLALGGILIVMASVSTALSIGSLFDIEVTLIISEVIPFLVLALGVDNIFIIVGAFQKKRHKKKYERFFNGEVTNEGEKRQAVEEMLAETLSDVGPSVLLATFSECLAFGLGAVTDVPAVRTFAFYSALAVFVDSFLQTTVFISLLAIDARRQMSGRVEVLPCFRLPFSGNFSSHSGESEKLLGEKGINSSGSLRVPEVEHESFIEVVVRRFLSPVLFHPLTKAFLLIFFVVLLCAGINFSTKLEEGLDQTLTVPKGSYLVDYFEAVSDVLRVGPPVYFVVKEDYDYSTPEGQNRICALGNAKGGCSGSSLNNLVASSALAPWTSHINSAATSWLDDYLSYLRIAQCCSLTKDGKDFCPSPNDPDCIPCSTFDEFGRPLPQDFKRFLSHFLWKTTCDYTCGLCGTGYQTDVILDPHDQTKILASRFRSYHTTMKNQSDFIDSLENAYNLTDTISNRTGLPVFPYSYHYIFFAQYVGLQSLFIMCVGIAIGAVFVVSMIMLRNVLLSLAVILTVSMIQVDLLGVMALWNVQLNAVSVVNLIMAVGISVEFCVHLAYAYSQSSKGTRTERAAKALKERGSSIFSGIFLTKLLGVLVLYFAQSQIFRVYYFRMYLVIVILGGLHGLIFLPVLLSIMGPRKQGSCFC